MLFIGGIGMVMLIVLVGSLNTWPLVLIAGCMPFVLLGWGAAAGLARSTQPASPSLIFLPMALWALASITFFRLLGLCKWEYVSFPDAPPGGWWIWWLTCLALSCAYAIPTFKTNGWVGMAVIYTCTSLLGTYTAFEILDVRLDKRPAISVARATIVDRQRRWGGKHFHIDLKLDSPSGSQAPAVFDADQWNTEQFKIGGTICFSDHAGALGMKWQQVNACS